VARPKKQTVDYFPHYVFHKRTMYIIENKYGNDGYAFWFKLLELLGSTEGHFYDCRNPSKWEFLLAKTRQSGVSATEILNTLAALDAIDAELWTQKVIWSQNFVDGVADVYAKRKIELPEKPSIRDENPIQLEFSGQKPSPNEVFDTGNTAESRGNPQSNLKKIEGKAKSDTYPQLPGFLTPETPISDTGNPQSKFSKFIKVNKSKGEESKIDARASPKDRSPDSVKNQAQQLLEFYKNLTGKTKIKKIPNELAARLKEGHKVDEGKKIILYKFLRWWDDPKMKECVNLTTLFRPSHFEEYLSQAEQGLDQLLNESYLDFKKRFIDEHMDEPREVRQKLLVPTFDQFKTKFWGGFDISGGQEAGTGPV